MTETQTIPDLLPFEKLPELLTGARAHRRDHVFKLGTVGVCMSVDLYEFLREAPGRAVRLQAMLDKFASRDDQAKLAAVI